MEKEDFLREVGKWIEENADETEYCGDDYEGQAWLIYPKQVEALKRGEWPEPEAH